MALETAKSKLSFHGVDITEVVFNLQKPYQFEESIDLDTDIRLLPQDDDNKNVFQLVMSLHLKVENYFALEVEGIGAFELNEVEDETERKEYININAVAIMFPYMRSFISTFSAQCGQSFPTLNIPPQFFKGDIQPLEESDM